MLRFNEEIKKFRPSLEVEKIQGNMNGDNMGDLLDLIKQMTRLDVTKSQQKHKDKE